MTPKKLPVNEETLIPGRRVRVAFDKNEPNDRKDIAKAVVVARGYSGLYQLLYHGDGEFIDSWVSADRILSVWTMVKI